VVRTGCTPASGAVAAAAEEAAREGTPLNEEDKAREGFFLFEEEEEDAASVEATEPRGDAPLLGARRADKGAWPSCSALDGVLPRSTVTSDPALRRAA